MKEKWLRSGQMTIELACALPVLIVVAVMVTNALSFFADCATFDRTTREAVRVYAASPGYGLGPEQACPLVEGAAKAAINRPNVDLSVSCAPAGLGFESFTAIIEFAPTLFGMGLRSEVFGVSLPRLTHEVTYTVDPFKPGVVI